MNDKIRRFTTQLSEAAPLAPDLEGRAIPTPRSSLTSSPITALRVGVAIAAVGVLGLVAVIVSANDDRGAVIPASGQTSEAISDAIQAALPDGFRVEFVERLGSPDAAPAHAVAVNDRLEVLDIEFMALTQPDENLEPEEMSPDTGPTEYPTTNDLVTDTTVGCITTTSVQGAVECLQYSDEGTVVTLSPPETAVPQPQCFVFGPQGDETSSTTSIPCTLEKFESGEVRIDADCTLYVRSKADILPSAPECPELAVIFDPTVGSTIPGSIVTDTTVPSDGSSNIEEGTSPVYDPFGVDPSGTPSPFQGASTRTSNLYVQVAHYGINQGVDVAELSSTVASSLQQIPNLAEAITFLPEPLAPADLNISLPREGSWVNGGVTSGSLSVSLWRGLTDGAVIVRISYPGSLEASGNDGDVFWQALTPAAGEGRVSIVHFQRGSRDALTDADAAALTYKIADAWPDARAVILGITQDILSVPAGGDQPPVTEAPVDTTFLSVP
jgi:hypothetical protein